MVGLLTNRYADFSGRLAFSDTTEIVAAGTRLRAWAESQRFPVLFDPHGAEPTAYTDYLRAPDPRQFEAAYRFNIRPVTDDSPCYDNYFRLTDWRSNRDDHERLHRFPIGNIILITLVALSVGSAGLFIVLPLWTYARHGISTPAALPTYFSMLGLGFMFVEIVLIQRFTLLIGSPTLAVTTTLASVLVFSGVGSLLGRQVAWTTTRLRLLCLAVATMVLTYAVGLSTVVSSLLTLGDGARLVAAVLLSAPVALALGVPFPSGLTRVARPAPGFVPWAWGMNGVCSVVGASAVILVSMVTSFTTAMVVAAAFDLVAAVSAGALDRVSAGPGRSAALPVERN